MTVHESRYRRTMATLIAEDLLLLLLHDERGTLARVTRPDAVLGGGLLVELALDEAVEVRPKTRWWRSATVHVVPGHAPADPLLRAAYDEVGARPRTAQDLVGRLGKGLQARLGARLASQGAVQRRDSRVLGLFPRTTWPVVDTARKEQVRRALAASLVQGLPPDERTGALIAILSAADQAHRVVDRAGLPAREVRKRAKHVAEGDWAAEAVRDAIAASRAAVTAAVAASTTVAATGS